MDVLDHVLHPHILVQKLKLDLPSAPLHANVSVAVQVDKLFKRNVLSFCTLEWNLRTRPLQL